jgi:TMEM175 potassium channel family protein
LSSDNRRSLIGLGKGRLESLTDGIFGTVMTVLILSLSVPIVTSSSLATENSQLITSLRGLLPDILSYVISFAILGSFWIRHHTMFYFVTNVDRILLWLNIIFLLTIGFIPFSTALLGRYPTLELSLIIYGANLIATSMASQFLWIYAVRKKLVSRDTIDEENISRITSRMTAGWIS